MTTTGKDTASFFENGTTEQFDYCYKLYPQVLKLKAEKRCKKPQELIRLDQWYQNELPKLIKARGKDAHMVYDELVQTMKWKQSRGKFYPQLSYLVKVNTPRAVMQETKKAFRKLPNLEQAITALSNLKGVGTTMASALLAAASPDSAPFMADECLMAIPEIEGIDYTTKEYLNFVQHIQSTVERLNTEAGGDVPFWSPHRVELALWSHYVANDLSPELLDEMPGPGSGRGGGVNTNGSTIKPNLTDADKVLDGNEDTNDADDESLGAAAVERGEMNNIATESETDNDNTNPAANIITAVSAGVLQDGDSNFVSNDSTSQEPIIDENTTQTTGTTSTDDGEVGTPLASDSESNLEAPQLTEKATTLTTNTTKTKTTANTIKNEINSGGANDAEKTAPIQQQQQQLSNKTNSINSSKSSSSVGGDADADADADDDNNIINSNNSNSKNLTVAAAAAAAVGNGNGTLLTLSGGGSGSVGDSLDGENSSCLRSSVNEEATDEDDEEDDDRMADESSNSNSRDEKSATPIINLNDGTNTDNDSTLSSAGIPIGQKRPLHCVNDAAGGDGGSLNDINCEQPDIKKIRNE